MKNRIYVVDDHALIRCGLTSLINCEPDLEVCGEAQSGPSTFKEIMRLKPDLVTVEISLNGSSGIELIKNIRAFDSKIKILVLSMHEESTYALRALRAGACGYLMKHEIIETVLQAIRRTCRGQLYVSDKIAVDVLNRISGGQTISDTSPVAALSDRELEIVNLIGRGAATREIAAKLYLSIKTVETHRRNIKHKLNLANGTQLLQFCIRWVGASSNAPEPIIPVKEERCGPFLMNATDETNRSRQGAAEHVAESA